MVVGPTAALANSLSAVIYEGVPNYDNVVTSARPIVGKRLKDILHSKEFDRQTEAIRAVLGSSSAPEAKTNLSVTQLYILLDLYRAELGWNSA